MNANWAACVGVAMLGLGFSHPGPALAQLGQTDAQTVMPSVPNAPGSLGMQPGAPPAASPIADPGGLNFGGAPNIATPNSPNATTGTGLLSGVADPGSRESGGTSSTKDLPSPRVGGPACAPPGSAAAFAGTSQPGLCPGTRAGGGGSPGAGFSGGAATSPVDEPFDSIDRR